MTTVNKKFPIPLHLLFVAIVCGMMTSGCWSAHPHSGYRTIHQCAINGDAVGVAAELAKFPDELNLPEDGGVTPLHLAAENCHTNVVVLLLEKGADLNIMADDKATPLHLASQQGCADVVAILLAKGADVNARDNQGRTPLTRAKLWHQDAIVQLLQAHGGSE
jgi:ankyrin repeat protein